MPPVILAFLQRLAADPAFLRKCLGLPLLALKWVASVAVVFLALALFAMGWAYTHGPEDVQVQCDGPVLSTPVGVKGVNYAERFGKLFHDLGDGKWTALDTVNFLNGVTDTWHVLWEAFSGPAKGDLEHSAVTGYRESNEKAREKALRFCCVQLWDAEGEPAPTTPPPPEEKDAPWDPKNAALMTGSSGRSFNSEQMDIARIVQQVAVNHGIPGRGVLIAFEVTLVESGGVNLNFGDRDSLGVFQQRPSAGWGTRAQVRDPELAAEAFFGVAKHTNNRGLIDIRNWQSRPMGEVAQAVQVSAFPDRYAAREADARAMLAAIGGASRSTTPKGSLKIDAKPQYDPAAPFASYCSALKSWGGTAGGDTDGSVVLGGGPVPADFDRLGNPRTVEQAIAWLTAAMPGGRNGERVQGRCERWMNLAFGLSSGFPTATAHWYAPGPKETSGTPPRGALVFIRSGNPAGHVILSLGNGQAISTDYANGKYRAGVIGSGSIDSIAHAMGGPVLGWRAPSFRTGAAA